MKTRDIRDYLNDIVEAASDIENFTKKITYQEFIKDKKTLYAVIRSIEIIGEASKQLPLSIKTKHSDIPWKEIAGMRDKLIHAYSGIDTETIWKTTKTDIPRLKRQIQNIQNETEHKSTKKQCQD
jgi:uncharacterized protein with HEPN domain